MIIIQPREWYLIDLLVIEVGEADVPDEAVIHKTLHLTPRLLKWGVPIESFAILTETHG